jgi:AraC-like DNA-binding protein
MVRLATQAPGEAPSPDPRIVKAIGEIERRLDQPISLDEIANAIHLSPGRLRHLFVEETGHALPALYTLGPAPEGAADSNRGPELDRGRLRRELRGLSPPDAHLPQDVRRRADRAGAALPDEGRAALRATPEGEG